MSPEIRDSRWPPSRPTQRTGPSAVLSQYPSYLSAPTPAPPPPTRSALVSAIAARAAAFVAMMLASVPVGMFVMARGFAIASRPATDAEIHHAALMSFIWAMVAMGVAGALAAGVVLWLRGARHPILAAVAGQVADYVGGSAGAMISDIASYVLGALAAVAAVYLIIRRAPSRAT